MGAVGRLLAWPPCRTPRPTPAVNARLELVARMRAYKRSQGMEFVDQAREDWMHRYLAAANRGPLSDQGLHEIYGHLLDLTKRETTAEVEET